MSVFLSLIVSTVPIKGMTYVSWQSGEYPYATGWKAQTYWNSRGIDSVRIDTFQGDGALKMYVHLDQNDSTRMNGEAFVNMLYFPPMSQPPQRETLVPVDMRGCRISCSVWCPLGSRGRQSAPNGIQVFVKDTSDSNSWYSPWQNIGTENAWNYIDTVVPESSPGVDLSHVVIVGFKVGVNTSGGVGFSGIMWLDDFNWGDSAVEYPFEQTGTSLDSLETTGCNFLSVVNTWYMESLAANSVDSLADYSHTREELAASIREAKRHGMRVMLKPQIDVPYAPHDTLFRGKIFPADRSAWFASYGKFVAWHASINPESTDYFCVGTELSALDTAFRDEWLRVIDTLRTILPSSCSLIYAANWSDSAYRKVCFWDSLDFAGIDAYFPLCTSDSMPSLAALVADWQDWKGDVNDWHGTIDKDVAFTEIGYISRWGANVQPWVSGGKAVFAVNDPLQARLYSAAIIAWDSLPWFKGRFWWHWSPACDAGGPWDDGYTPQNKLAQDTLDWYWHLTGVVETPARERGRGMLQVLPSPTRGLLRLRGYHPDAVLEICDAAGRRLMELHSGANDVSGLAPGVYFVHAAQAQAQAQAVLKVVIAR